MDGVPAQSLEAPPAPAARPAPPAPVLPVLPVLAGPATRERAGKVLAQALGAVWEGMLEARGHPTAAGWRVVVGELWVVPAARSEEDADG